MSMEVCRGKRCLSSGARRSRDKSCCPLHKVSTSPVFPFVSSRGPSPSMMLQSAGVLVDPPNQYVAWCYRTAGQSNAQDTAFERSTHQDREAAKLFLKRALANPDNRPPHVFARDGLRSYPAALRELQAEGHVARHCRKRTRRYCNKPNRIRLPPREAATARHARA